MKDKKTQREKTKGNERERQRQRQRETRETKRRRETSDRGKHWLTKGEVGSRGTSAMIFKSLTPSITNIDCRKNDDESPSRPPRAAKSAFTSFISAVSPQSQLKS